MKSFRFFVSTCFAAMSIYQASAQVTAYQSGNICSTMIPPSPVPPDGSTCWRWYNTPSDGITKVGTPPPQKGCNYKPCQDAVCFCDPYCCSTAWDLSCRGYDNTDGVEDNFFVNGCSAMVLCCEPDSAYPKYKVETTTYGGATASSTVTSTTSYDVKVTETKNTAQTQNNVVYTYSTYGGKSGKGGKKYGAPLRTQTVYTKVEPQTNVVYTTSGKGKGGYSTVKYAQVQTVPVQTVQVKAVPVQTVQVQTVPVQTVQVQTVPVVTANTNTVVYSTYGKGGKGKRRRT